MCTISLTLLTLSCRVIVIFNRMEEVIHMSEVKAEGLAERHYSEAAVFCCLILDMIY